MMHKLARMAVSAALISILGACMTEGRSKFDTDAAKLHAASFGAAASQGIMFMSATTAVVVRRFVGEAESRAGRPYSYEATWALATRPAIREPQA